MKKKISVWLSAILLLLTLLPVTAYADIGPKPSVQIRLEGLGGGVCYGTLLAKEASTGPAYVWDGDASHQNPMELPEDVWQAFVNYQDPDGYHFLQWAWRCDETKELHWNYYPPQSFKLLLYFPAQDAFVAGDICERYAFDSYFTATAGEDGAQITAENVSCTVVKKGYDYLGELPPLLCRIVLTVLLELLVAWLFSLRTKKQLLTILWVNAVTQVGLNVALNLVSYRSGPRHLALLYAPLELLVFAAEAALYCVLLRKAEEKPSVKRLVLYALAANAVSFAAGLLLARWIPQIF